MLCRCLQLEWLCFQGNGWLFNWEWGPQAEECVNKASASGQGSSWDPGPSSASSSLDTLYKSFPLSRTQFPHVEKERPWRSHPYQSSLDYWLRGGGLGWWGGYTLPLVTRGVGLHPLSWEQPSLGHRMSFLPDRRPRPSPDQRDLCGIPLGASGGQGQNLANLGKRPLAPIDSGSAVRRHSLQ